MVMFKNIYFVVWQLQKVIRRVVPIARIDDLSISTFHLETKYFKICKILKNKSDINNYKKPMIGNRRIVKLYKPVLNPKTGILWMNDSIIEESSVWPISKLLLWEPNPLIYPKFDGIVTNLPDNGYYHLIIEDLPRFLQCVKYHPEASIVIGSTSKYINDVLKLIKINKIYLSNNPIRCKELIFSEKNLGGIFSKLDHKLLLDLSKEILPTISKKIVFIKRKNNSKGFLDRGIQFSKTIENKFKSIGAEIVALEDLSISAQIACSKSADILVGFHGAGLANMVWMDKPRSIIEITETRVTNHFAQISKVCGHSHKLLIASELNKLSLQELQDMIF